MWAAVLWAIFSSLPQPVMAVPAFLFVNSFVAMLPLGLGFAAGAMLAMVFSEMIHDARRHASTTDVVLIMISTALFPIWWRTIFDG